MLEEVAADQLWIADMPAAKAGFEFGARMTVVRLPDGGLWIHSPVALSPELQQQLDALGPVRAILAPARMHYEHVPEFADAYPDAKVFAVPGARKIIEKKARVDGIIGETPDPLWAGVMDQVLFHGSRLYDEVDFLHRPTGTLILTDLCFNIPENRSWSTRLWARLLGILGRLSVSRSLKLSIQDRDQVRASLERILAWDFDRVLITHGDWVPSGGKEAFHRAVAPVLESLAPAGQRAPDGTERK